MGSTSGAILALLVGFCLSLAHYSFFLSLLAFFVSSSKATRFKQQAKANFEADFKEDGQRNWLQVLCNGGMATELSLLYLLDIGSSDLPVDFRQHYRASWLGCAVLGALSCWTLAPLTSQWTSGSTTAPRGSAAQCWVLSPAVTGTPGPVSLEACLPGDSLSSSPPCRGCPGAPMEESHSWDWCPAYWAGW